MFEVVEWTIEELPEAKPRHLLGIGEVDDLVRGVELGHRHLRLRDADPHRPPRHGARARPGDAAGASTSPRRAGARPTSRCSTAARARPASEGYSRAYLHYLFKAKEQTAMRLLTIHNLAYLAAPDGRAARRDRRGPPAGGRRRGARRRGAVGAAHARARRDRRRRRRARRSRPSRPTAGRTARAPTTR